ncbi:hypothetical protein [Eikenella corrodens]|nr:hypothetical protein [Eikenella corrodens]
MASCSKPFVSAHRVSGSLYGHTGKGYLKIKDLFSGSLKQDSGRV